EGVRRGGDRQVLHERVRVHALAAADALKEGAAENDLFHRLAGDPLIPLGEKEIESLARPQDYVGMAPVQVDRFLAWDIDPMLQDEEHLISSEIGEVRV
ncbi:MAG TPA: adenylosuccinate lyase, partial [Thermoanaerobaculia bacterium]|nr:adenylosuccinate lyase [Thermoanaerobaculia bacterium]